MSKNVTIRTDLYNRWRQEKDIDNLTELSFSDWIDSLIVKSTGFNEATISMENRVSENLRGKTILYRLKDH